MVCLFKYTVCLHGMVFEVPSFHPSFLYFFFSWSLFALFSFSLIYSFPSSFLCLVFSLFYTFLCFFHSSVSAFLYFKKERNYDINYCTWKEDVCDILVYMKVSCGYTLHLTYDILPCRPLKCISTMCHVHHSVNVWHSECESWFHLKSVS